MSKDDQTTLEDVEMITIPKHVLELLLKGPQLVREAVTRTETASNNSIRTQRDELERLVGAWSLDKSQTLFISCLDDVGKNLFELDGIPITEYAECLGATLIGCISNSWDHEHQMGHRGKTEEQRIKHARKRNHSIVTLLSNMARLRNLEVLCVCDR